MPRSTPPALVAGIPDAARLHIVTGKGGTGKTTVAAALALAIAGQGKDVLLVEVEGRQAIAQLFDVPALPYSEQRLASAPNGGQLVGLAIDAEQAMLEYLDMFYNLKRAARALQKLGAVDFVTTLAPGLRDVLLTGKIKEAVGRTEPHGSNSYDAVVVDAPPTGRIRQFLDATKEVANLAKFGPINKQSLGVMELLHSPRTALHLVTLLEEMPVQETVDAVGELAEADYAVASIVVNRARPTLIDGPTGTQRTLTKKLTAAFEGTALATAQAPALATEMIAYAERQKVEQDARERLADAGRPMVELPDLHPPVALSELSQLSQCFYTGSDA